MGRGRAPAGPAAGPRQSTWRWVLAAILTGCGAPAFPDPPDLSAVAALYAEPDGDLEEEALRRELEQMFDRLDRLQRVDGLSVVTELSVQVEADPGPLIESAREQGNLAGARVRILADVTYRCRGPGGEPEREDDHGHVKLHVLAGLSGIESTLWGTIERCTERGYGEHFVLDGEVTVRLGRRRAGQADVLVAFCGSVELDGEILQLDLDFERRGDGRLTVRHSLADGGSVLVTPVDEGADVVLVRDRTGTWRCARASLRCRSNDGERTIQFGSAS